MHIAKRYYPSILKYAYESYNNEPTPAHQRDLALVETFICLNGDLPIDLSWHQIHFSKEPYIEIHHKYFDMNDTCYHALWSWCETLWDELNKANIGMSDKVFCRHYAATNSNSMTQEENNILSLNLDLRKCRYIIDTFHSKAQDAFYDSVKKQQQNKEILETQQEGKEAVLEQYLKNARILKEKHPLNRDFDMRRKDNLALYETYQSDRKVIYRIFKEGYLPAYQVA